MDGSTSEAAMHGSSVKDRLRLTAAALAIVMVGVGSGGATNAAVGPSSSQPSPGSSGIGDPYYPLYGNGGYDARRYQLRVRYDPETDRLSAKATIVARARRDLSRYNLDLVGLRVHRVRVDGHPATWTRRAGHELVIAPSTPIADNARFRTVVRYSGVPGHIDDPAAGPYGFLATSDGALAVGEPEVAAFWYPVNDHPRDKARYRVRLTVPRGLQTVSNGLRAERVVHGAWVTTRWTTRDPMASYLLFAAVGRFDLHRWRTGSGLPVLDAVDSSITGPLRQRIDRSLGRQGAMLRHLVRWFGPYPFETVGGLVDDSDLGFALENQTRPIYPPYIWNIPNLPTLGDDVVVHELAHQWYGDSVAIGRWRDIWLNEGFATYAEWLWQRAEHGFTPAEIMSDLYQSIPADDSFWTLKIGEPGTQGLFLDPVYVRGAMTLQALRATIGRHDFFEVLRSWAAENRNGNGRTAGFIRLAERVSGQELSPLFHAWLFTEAKPALPTALRPGSVASRPDPRLRRVVEQWRTGLEVRLERRPPH
jgi:Peptidase family M1 domain/Peptidase M1 N-terminal domain